MNRTFFSLVTAMMAMQLVLAEAPESSPTANALRFDAEAKECALKPGETVAAFTFVVTNVSNAEVVIHRLSASCGCTAAKLPTMPYALGAGSNVAINVEMQLAGKYGLIRKSVVVDSSAGIRALTVSANVPTEVKTAANE